VIVTLAPQSIFALDKMFRDGMLARGRILHLRLANRVREHRVPKWLSGIYGIAINLTGANNGSPFADATVNKTLLVLVADWVVLTASTTLPTPNAAAIATFDLAAACAIRQHQQRRDSKPDIASRCFNPHSRL
jgi:hypothetical protein